ncbi:hypothetical protein, partial [Vibrio parahaemolyticus]
DPDFMRNQASSMITGIAGITEEFCSEFWLRFLANSLLRNKAGYTRTCSVFQKRGKFKFKTSSNKNLKIY